MSGDLVSQNIFRYKFMSSYKQSPPSKHAAKTSSVARRSTKAMPSSGGSGRVAETPATNYARLEARVNPELKQRFQEAANIQGRTLTDFMIAAMEEIASRTIKQQRIMELSVADQEAFVNALIKPSEPSDELKRAVKRYKQLGL